MQQMKRAAARTALIMGLCSSVLAMSACGSTSTGSGGGNAAAPSAASSSWAVSAGLNKTETADELYAKAKGEGSVVLYSMSSRVSDVKDSFEAKYPGVKLEAYNISSVDMLEKLIREHGAGIYNADVIFTKDTGGTFTMELLKKGIVHKYMPSDIVGKMPEPYKSQVEGLVPYVEARGIFYNADVYKTPPITNWWDLTTPDWKGRVMLSDPMKSADTMDLFLGMVQNSDDMKQAYKDKFGKDIELNGSPNAGYEFIKRLSKNDLILTNSGGDIVKAVGKPGQAKPPIGLAVSTKLREAQGQGLKLGVSYDVKPKVSQVEQALLYVGDQSKHPNAAKLLIRWMAGEADGKAAGLKPFNIAGAWATRSDVTQVEELPLSKLNVWKYDPVFFYENSPKIRDFWLKQQ
ncbi:ABC transporter substrate-binding protein [Paenibacillus radicis (ex Xue et al. 2023)]|uniref:Extracellular solute-binding protein n=1 Tax=Paenibacillus radicis (ex Xue et al. 2023) TaxID=2972489 RepID=A0ABT1YIW3_9BACL|nr:extracellular solute-binding protein [Paenibacillus radicis (ex Xue et al. 2023)]MCR8633115.1 extracellular solute-binding protein [Paenibacillus radicis (ex Xue et al. 2023)]